MRKYTTTDCKGNYLQDKLIEIFKNKKNGVFIELGANNGIVQSNTIAFEKYFDWTGILIEPSKSGYESCLRNRPKSLCFNYACVSNEYNEEYVEGDFDGHCMSSVNGNRLNRGKTVKVKAITLSKLLDKCKVENIDFLSLDTEGYEYNILKGLDISKHRPKYILIELYPGEYDNVVEFLHLYNYKQYKCPYTKSFSFTNYNKIDNPNWDGTHNDYLFVDGNI